MKTLLVALLLLVVGTGTAFAECAWALWAYQTNRVGVDIVRDLQAVFPTRDKCLAFGAGWAEIMQERIRNDLESKDLAWSWSCTSIPEPLFKDAPRHQVR